MTQRLSRGKSLRPSFDAWLLPLAACLVPALKRQEWLREWQAEFWHLRHGGSTRRSSQSAAESLSLAWGVVTDASWVGLHTLRLRHQGTAQLRLYKLALACIACFAGGLISVGSWHALNTLLLHYFLARFLPVMAPGLFVAIATLPRRPRKCAPGQRLSGLLHRQLRWTLFLSAKIALSILLAFLFCVLVSIPASHCFGHNSDWVDFLLSTATITTGVRLSFADQMQRCQRCLRLLRQPVRVGPPSYNLLNWSGTELVCAEGHGLLQVPEMQGSWCWYDLWIEDDHKWASA